MCQNTALGTELPHIFCALIGPLQLAVVLVILIVYFLISITYSCKYHDITSIS